MNVEDRIREVEDWREILELRHRYGYYLDDMDWDRWLELFTDDVRCDYGWYGQVDGIEELREMTSFIEEKFEYSAHINFQPLISVNGDTATGEWYAVVYHAFTDEAVGGWRQLRYSDTYRRVDGEWKFAEVSHTFYSRNLFQAERRDTEKEGNVVEYMANELPEE